MLARYFRRRMAAVYTAVIADDTHGSDWNVTLVMYQTGDSQWFCEVYVEGERIATRNDDDRDVCLLRAKKSAQSYVAERAA